MSAIETKKEIKKTNDTVVEKGLPASLMLAIQQAAEDAALSATKNALNNAKIITSELMTEVENKLNGIAQSFDSMPILHVQIGEQQVKKLDQPAVKYLGRMIANAKLSLNTLLVGPAGAGKTTAAEQLAQAMNLTFGHLNLTAGASETWLFGRQTPNGFVEGQFSKFYREGGVFLADEIDAADPNLLLSINTAIASDKLYNPISGESIQRNENFVFVGAANTYGKGGSATYTGRSRLDAATLDRFVVIEVDYDPDVEKMVCPDSKLLKMFNDLRTELKRVQSQEVISTRGIKAAYKQISAGLASTDVLNSMVLSWPQDLKSFAKKKIETYTEKSEAKQLTSKAKSKADSEKEWF